MKHFWCPAALTLLCALSFSNPAPAQVGANCADAREILDDGVYPFSTIGISRDDPCRTFSRTYWFLFVPAADGHVLAETCGFDPNFNTFLSAFEGESCPATCTGRLTTGDDECGLQSRIEFSVQAGKTYRIAASGFGTLEGNSSLRFVYTADETPPLLGDINGDGIINVSDLTLLAKLIAEGNPPPNEVGDINGDGKVDEADIQALAELIVNG